MIDIHCHILPGVDDGARDVTESVQMAGIAFEEGIRCIAATPHYHPFRNNHERFLERRGKALHVLNKALQNYDIPVKILSGAEIRLCYELHKLKGLESLCIEGTRALLIECTSATLPVWFHSELSNLKNEGFIPILAHAEFVSYFDRHLEVLKQYVDEGLLIQVNSMSITAPFYKSYRRLSKKILKNGLAHFIATDAHNVDLRAPKIKNALIKAKSFTGGELYNMAEIIFNVEKE